MHLLRYSLAPALDHPEREQLGEGFVNCWIERPTLDEADAVARNELQADHWQILDRESAEETTRDDYAEDDDGLQYYEQALSDKEVFVFYLSPRHPVYWVTAAVTQGSPAEVAEAHYFLAGEAIMQEDEDLYSPDFWSSDRQRAALDGAREAIAEAGWTLTAVIEERPCGPLDLPEELLPYYDEAEESGSCLVFVHGGEGGEGG